MNHGELEARLSCFHLEIRVGEGGKEMEEHVRGYLKALCLSQSFRIRARAALNGFTLDYRTLSIITPLACLRIA